MKYQGKRGITLIALIITIIVLLILSGVSIATLVGDSGILRQATRAKEESDKASIIEQIQLDIVDKQIENQGTINEDEFYEILRKYGTISADETVLTTTKGNYEILISDIYGGEVASSLVTTSIESWEYTLDGENIILNKYIGSDSRILIPNTFNISSINYSVIIGITTGKDGPFATNSKIECVKFDDNINIESNNGHGLFCDCINLSEVYNIPEGCTRLDYAFQGCTNLTYIDKLPENLTNLTRTFNGCQFLESVPDIPSQVTNMDYTFAGCVNLNGKINIKSNDVSSASNCFLNSGNSNILINVNRNSTTYETFNNLIGDWSNVSFYNEQALKIVCWGDSLTYGAGGNGTSYVSVLNNLCNDEAVAYNMGVGGEKTSTIAGRQGGIPMVVESFIIPSDTSKVEITIKGKDGSEVAPAMQNGNGLNNCFISGIEGIITYDSSTEKWYFNRILSGLSVTVQEDTEVITDGMKNYNDADILIIWTGQNDGASTSNISDIIEKQKKMIEYANTDKYIILGLLYSGNEVNSVMAEAYGEHFLDVRNALSTDNSNTVSEDYKYDSVHLNADGYTIVGEQVYNKLILLGDISE